MPLNKETKPNQINTLGKSVNPLILPAMGWIVPLLFFLENSFVIK